MAPLLPEPQAKGHGKRALAHLHDLLHTPHVSPSGKTEPSRGAEISPHPGSGRWGPSAPENPFREPQHSRPGGNSGGPGAQEDCVGEDGGEHRQRSWDSPQGSDELGGPLSACSPSVSSGSRRGGSRCRSSLGPKKSWGVCPGAVGPAAGAVRWGHRVCRCRELSQVWG